MAAGRQRTGSIPVNVSEQVATVNDESRQQQHDEHEASQGTLTHIGIAEGGMSHGIGILFTGRQQSIDATTLCGQSEQMDL